jgi:hypothetical protein
MRRTHGMSKTTEYRIYEDAKRRCRNPQRRDYHLYGGRGIEFRFASFEDFYSKLGERPSKNHSLDRIENSGHYETGNVKWSTAKQQAANRRNKSLQVTCKHGHSLPGIHGTRNRCRICHGEAKQVQRLKTRIRARGVRLRAKWKPRLCKRLWPEQPDGCRGR